jgi:hypothetical protein
MDYKKISEEIQLEIEKLFQSLNSGISAREDSRAFGAMIEKHITENWLKVCSDLGYHSIDIPGKRTIYDFACKIENKLFGFDVKTKDLDSTSYSDGGVCAIGNLFKFLANDHGVFMIVEFGHEKSNSKQNARDIKYIRVAPFHCLPEKTYRIENLGTGQIRLNNTINQVSDEIDWNRNYSDFFHIFCNLAVSHYNRVKSDAEKRITSIEQFNNRGHQNFRFIR